MEYKQSNILSAEEAHCDDPAYFTPAVGSWETNSNKLHKQNYI